VLVLSYLSQQFLPRLTDAVRQIGADHVQASCWDEVQALIRRKPVSLLVLDPYADRANRVDDIVTLLQQFPSTPVIVYTEFTPPALRVLTLLAQYGLQETLLFQIDDDCARLSRLLTRLATLPLVLRLLHEVRSERSRLTPQLADALDDLFKRPHAYASGRDLVLVSQTPLTSLYRAFIEAGFAPPKQLFIAARVLHAVVYVRDPGSTVRQVAEKVGYQHPRVLTQHTLAVFGRRPSELRDTSDDEALPPLLRWTRLSHPGQDDPADTIPSDQIPFDATQSNIQRVPADIADDQPCIAQDVDAAVIWGTWIGYGQYLERIGQRMFAVALYQISLVVLQTPNGYTDSVAAAAMLLRLGFVLRFLGDFDASYNAYQRARPLAEQANVIPLALRSRIGMANTLMRQGNLGEAETLLDHVVADAVAFEETDLECNGCHSRGAVRTRRGRYGDAMRDFFRAYELAENTSKRELILGDFAGCAGAAGYRKLASDAYHRLLRTGQLPIVTSAALAGLLEFAVYDGDLVEFERLKTRFEVFANTHPLPADHTLEVALYTAYGAERFKTQEIAIAAYRAVIIQAHALGSHQVRFKAEQRLWALTTGAVPLVNPPICEPPDSLRDLANAIAEWSGPEEHPVFNAIEVDFLSP